MTIKDNEGLTPLDIAKKSESKECVELIQKSQEPEETSNNANKGLNEEVLEVEVHESNKTPSDHDEEKESNSERPLDTDTDRQDKVDEQDKVDNSIQENLEEEPPAPKKKKRISFLLPGDQEPVPIDNEQEECEDIIPQDDKAVTMIESEKAASMNDSEVCLSEPTVSRSMILQLAQPCMQPLFSYQVSDPLIPGEGLEEDEGEISNTDEAEEHNNIAVC